MYRNNHSMHILLLVFENASANTRPGWEAVTSQSAIDALGVEIGEPITNGFVFIDGRYMPPPYVVKREGNGVLINNRLIEERIPWPIISVTPPQPVLTLPVQPESITSESTPYDVDVAHYISTANQYYFQKYGRESIAERMKPIFAALPCVENVLLAGPARLRVFWKDGTNSDGKIVTMLDVPDIIIEEWTPEAIIENGRSRKAMYERRLPKDDYFFLPTPYSMSNRITGTWEGAVDVLIPLIPILETSQAAEEVHTRFNALEIVPLGERSAKAFFDNRDSITPELKERLEALRVKLIPPEEF